MAMRDQNFYALNGQRAYPIDDAATGIDDTGHHLPYGILVDAKIRFSNLNGQQTLYVAAINVAPPAVSILFLASMNPIRRSSQYSAVAEAGFTPVASIDVANAPKFTAIPIVPVTGYTSAATINGIAGWVVLGDGIDFPYTGRFSTPGQAALLPRCASAYTIGGIKTAGIPLTGNPLNGQVSLASAGDLALTTGTKTIAGTVRNCVIFSLSDKLDRGVLQTYSGPGGARPESGTCTNIPIETINNVQPDCSGNIVLTFGNATAVGLAGGGGISLQLPQSVADLCGTSPVMPSATGQLPGAPADLCLPPVSMMLPPTAGVIDSPTVLSFDSGMPANVSVKQGVLSAGQGFAMGLSPEPALACAPDIPCGGHEWLTHLRGGAGLLLGYDHVAATGYAVISDAPSLSCWQLAGSWLKQSEIEVASPDGWQEISARVSGAGEVSVTTPSGAALPLFTVNPAGVIGFMAQRAGGEITRITGVGV